MASKEILIEVHKMADRWVLSIAGWHVAHEGGVCICSQFEDFIWDKAMLEEAAREIRGEINAATE